MGQQVAKLIDLQDLLHQNHLAPQMAAEGRLEARLDLDEGVGHFEALGIDGARRVDIAQVLLPIGPHRVFHVEAQRMLPAVGGDGAEVDLLKRRPMQREQQLAQRVMAQRVDVADPSLQGALLKTQRQPLPRRAVLDRGNRYHVVGHAAAHRVVGVPQQPRVVGAGQRRHQARAEGLFKLIRLVAVDLVHLVEKKHRHPPYSRN